MFKKILVALGFFCGTIFCYGDTSSQSNSDYDFSEADKIIKDDVRKGFGGAVLLVIKDGKIVKKTAYGYRNMFDPDCQIGENYEILPECYLSKSSRQRMTVDTVFDLASLTKVYSTVFAMMHLMYEGRLDINKPVAKYIKGYRYKDVTVKQVAEHTAGFGPEVNFYNRNDIMFNDETVEKNDFYSQNRARSIDLITGRNDSLLNESKLIVPMEYKSGTEHIYSDTDFILLGIIIETIVGMPLDEYVEQEIYQPLGINTVYNPIEKGIDINMIAQTAFGNWAAKCDESSKICKKEAYDNMRESPIRGYAHDEKVFYSFKGISGHAGLFGSAEDLAVLIQVLLNSGEYNGVTFFDQKTIDLFTSPVDEANDTYGVGWRIKGKGDSMNWMMGERSSSKTYGHTGFTGMDTIIDPENDMAIILLTNKLQSQQLSKSEFSATKDYATPNYRSVLTAVQKSVGL